MTSEEAVYYRARAREEREAAGDASKSEVAAIHQELARLYDALARQPELGVMRKVA